MRMSGWLLSWVLLVVVGLEAEELPGHSGRQLEIIYVGNEGFLLQTPSRKVLVDALVGDYQSTYIEVKSSVREALEAGSEPFDNVDLVLATHYHADHFGAESVLRFLKSNTRARFVGPEQAVHQLRQLEGFETQVALRVQGITPEEGGRIGLESLKLEIVFLHHGRYRQPLVENNGYLIHLGEWTVFHVGDTEIDVKELSRLQLPQDDIDVALLPQWFLQSGENLAFEVWWQRIQAAISPKFVALMHLPPGWAQSNAGKGILQWLGPKKSRPSKLLVFQKSLESRILERE